MNRRRFLHSGLVGAALTTAATAGLLAPRRVLAKNWPEGAFQADSEADAVTALFGNAPVSASDRVVVQAPRQGNSQSVAVSVDSTLDDVEAIALTVANNPQPLAATVKIGEHARGYFSTRIKMHETSSLTAYVKAGGKLYSATTSVKISVGGYGINHP